MVLSATMSKKEERRCLYTRYHKPVVITKSPGKPNLAYPVHEKSEMEEVRKYLMG